MRSMRFALCLVALALASCNGGSSIDHATPASAKTGRGAVVKGPVQNAQVQLFALDDAGFATGPALTTLTSDGDGRFTFERASDGPALLAIARGGSFVDESDAAIDPAARRRIALGVEEGFEAVLPAGATTLVITPYTQARLNQVRRAARGRNFLSFLTAASEQSVVAFGFDPAAVLPEPPLAPSPDASAQARNYAMLLGGAAQAIQAQSLMLGTVPSYATVRAFIDDLSDGRIDGRLDGAPVIVQVGDRSLALPDSVDLNAEVLRFYNNHFAAYAGVAPARVDEDALAIIPRPGNRPPLASDDAYMTRPDTALSITAPGVLGNDSDADGDALTAVLAVGPANGTLELVADGSLIYTPATAFVGDDAFTYRASDGNASSNVATVSIRVDERGNRPPTAVADRYDGLEDIALTIDAPGVLSNDVNGGSGGSGALTALLVLAPANGTLTLAPDGGLSYLPASNFNGSDTFTYRARNDNGDSNFTTVTLELAPVNDAPVAVADSYVTSEETALVVAARGVLANDSDVEGNPLTAVIDLAPEHGALELAANGGFTYTPDAGFNGNDRFSYRASDGSAQSAPTAVSIAVNGSNDVPVAANDAYATDEELALTVAAPGVLDNDTDADGQPLTAVLVTGPLHGTLTLTAIGGFTYTPQANFNGSDSFSYQASDGIALSAVATVGLSVRGSNDAPVAAPDLYSTPEDVVLSVAGPGVLGNDVDPDGPVLIAMLVAGPAHGTLVLAENGGFTYTPALDFTGSDSFSYQASDSIATSAIVTVALAVGPLSDPPIAGADAYSVDEGASLTVAAAGVLANDRDPDGAALTAVLVSGPAHGTLELAADGGFIYTHDGSESTSDSFVYRASDGLAQSANTTVSLTVNPVNDAPIATADVFSTGEDAPLTVPAPGVLGNDSDGDGDTLTATLVNPPASGTLVFSANGGFTYTPVANFNGAVSFSYRASDGTSNSNVVTVALNVSPVNDVPLAADDSYNGSEDLPLVVPAPGVLGNDSDTDGQALSAALVTAPESGTLTLKANGGFTYTPAPNASGIVSFTYRASDGTADSNVATVVLNLAAVDDAPLAVADAYPATEDTPLVIAAPGVLGNDSDAEGEALLVGASSEAAHGTLVADPSGSFTYTPQANFNGTDTFTYRASDGSAPFSPPATVTITVAAVNDAPLAQNDVYTADEDVPLTVLPASGLLANDSDVDGTMLTATMLSAVPAAQGVLAANADGSFVFTPASDFNGAVTFTYTASDGTLSSAAATVTINVAPVNDVPTLTINDNVDVQAGATFVLSVAQLDAMDVDNPPAQLIYAIVTPPGAGELRRNAQVVSSFTAAQLAAGLISYVHGGSSQPTLDQFSFTLKDAAGAQAANTVPFAQFRFNIQQPNQAPVVTAPVAPISATLLQTAIVGVQIADADAGANPLTVTLAVTNAARLIVDTGVAGGITAGQVSNNNSPSVAINAPQAQINATLAAAGGLIFDNVTGKSGNKTLSVSANDNGNTGSGGAKQGMASFLVQINRLPLAALATTPGLGSTLNGVAAGDMSGISVSGIGDFNGDSVDDFAVGASQPGGRGRTYVVFGENGDLPAALDLNALDGSDGFVFSGVTDGESAGFSVRGAGDVSGDGIADLVIGAPAADPGSKTDAGRVYVVYGRNGTFTATFDLAELDGFTGYAIVGENGKVGSDEGDALGVSVSGAGNVNDDIFDDLIIGAFHANPASVVDAGSAYVIYGHAPNDVVTLDLATTLLDGTNGFRVNGRIANDELGSSVAGIGHFNNDAFDDVVIGARLAEAGDSPTDAGVALVIFGGAVIPSSIELETLTGANGVILIGENAGGRAGFSVGRAGDVDGDSFDDVILGALAAGGTSGTSYVVLGRASFSGTLGLAGLSGPNGFQISTGNADGSGASVTGVGDFDGDGRDDLLIGAPRTSVAGSVDAGAAYLVFGRGNIGAGGSLNLAAGFDGLRAIRLEGVSPSDQAGLAVGAAGDVNKDGHADLLIGAPLATQSAGQTYLIYGSTLRTGSGG